MRRPFLLLTLACALVAFGLPTLSRQLFDSPLPWPGHHAEEGALSTSEGTVRFTLYWPSSAGSTRTLVILAADARTPHPRPLRLLAQAAAAAGFASVYLEPSPAPAEAAARLKGLLERNAATLGLDSASVWTWVEGRRIAAPAARPCRHSSPGSPLATLELLRQHLDAPGALLRSALHLFTQSGCSTFGRL